MATFAFTQSVASCASLKSVRGKSATKARRGGSVIRAANLMDTCRSAGLTSFADLVEKNGLTGEINSGTFTVFAPTNEAVAAFTNPDGTHSTVDILKFHCIKGKIAAKVRFCVFLSFFRLVSRRFRFAGGFTPRPAVRIEPIPIFSYCTESYAFFSCVLTSLPLSTRTPSPLDTQHITNYPLIMTLEGTKIAIDSKSTPGKVEVGAPPQGTQGLSGRVDGGFVVKMDIEADNGVIHVLDGVASPKAPLIGQNGGYVAGTEPGSGAGRTGLDTKVSSGAKNQGGGW